MKFPYFSLTCGNHAILVDETDSIYVDDYNVLYYILPAGTRWNVNQNEAKMEVVDDLINEDGECSEDLRSLREIVKMASICLVIQLQGKDKNLAILDLKCWIENGRVYCEHYTKPIASELLITRRSAMPERVKKATLTQAAFRILANIEALKYRGVEKLTVIMIHRQNESLLV